MAGNPYFGTADHRQVNLHHQDTVREGYVIDNRQLQATLLVQANAMAPKTLEIGHEDNGANITNGDSNAHRQNVALFSIHQSFPCTL